MALTTMLHANSTLKTLMLGAPQITDDSTRAFATTLQATSTVEQLNLSDGQIVIWLLAWKHGLTLESSSSIIQQQKVG